MHYAQCPTCQSTLQVEESKMKTQDGLIRCGHCSNVFNASNCVRSEPEDTPDKDKPSPKTNEPMFGQEASLEQEQDDYSTVAVWERDSNAKKTASYYDLWSVILLLLLMFQLVYFKPETFHQNASLQPLLQRINASFNTDIPRYKNLNEIRVISRQLFPHPSIKKALQLDLAIKNTAAASQEFPIISVILTSNLGEKVAYGNFKKELYLTRSERHGFLQAGETKTIKINFYAPQEKATGFEIKFI